MPNDDRVPPDPDEPPVVPTDTPAQEGTDASPGVDAPGAIDPVTPPSKAESTGRLAVLVAVGILASRVLGLVRSALFGRYFGTSPSADTYNAAMRIPNFLQNLFGEGVLSASFIPVYAQLVARGEDETADRVAAAVGALLAIVVAILVAVGVVATPLLVSAFAVGFDGAKREQTIRLIRIAFPGIGLLVGSAWCLGVLNSHRRFLLSYLAPVAWNVVLIGTLLLWGHRVDPPRLAVILVWGAVVGSAAQLLVQIPSVLRVAPRLALGHMSDAVRANVRSVVRNFGPVFVGRGVVQISGLIDNSLASLVGDGAVTVFTNAQTLYLLPTSLFGMSISAAELPAMSSLQGGEAEVAARLRTRLDGGLRRIAFFVVPSAMAFLALGDVIAAAIFRYGRFTQSDVNWVWGTLAGSSVGLLASTLGRLYASTFYALKETRTPLRFALIRVALTLGLGYVAARPLPHLLGIDPRWGTAGLTATAGVAGWIEFSLLRRALNARIGRTGIAASVVARLWGAAGVAAATGFALKLALHGVPRVATAVVVVGSYGLVYLGITAWLGEGESAALVARVRRRALRR